MASSRLMFKKQVLPEAITFAKLGQVWQCIFEWCQSAKNTKIKDNTFNMFWHVYLFESYVCTVTKIGKIKMWCTTGLTSERFVLFFYFAQVFWQQKKMQTNKLPLDGVTVIDLSRLYPGPLATLLLSDMGATVIRVEDDSKPGT